MQLNQFKRIFLCTFFVSVYPIASWAQTTAKPGNMTWSDFERPVEGNTPLKRQIFLDEMAVTNAAYATSASGRAIQTKLRLQIDKEKVISSSPLLGGRRLKLIKRGLGKQTDLVIFEADGTQTVIFSSTTIDLNRTMNFLSLNVSPDKTYVVLISEKNGSIDDYNLNVINLATRTLMTSKSIQMVAGNSSIRWIGPQKFYYKSSNNVSFVVDLSTSIQALPAENKQYYGKFPYYLECNAKQVIYHDDASTPVKAAILSGIDCGDWETLLKIDADSVEFVKTTDDSFSAIRYDVKTPGTPSVAPVTLFTQNQRVYSDINLVDDVYTFVSFWGVDQFVTIYDEQGRQLDEIKLPEYASFWDIESTQVNQAVSITFDTNVSDDVSHKYDYVQHRWLDAPNRTRDLTLPSGKTYIDRVIMVPSSDGVQIPMRLTYDQNTALTPTTPVLIKVYGGYGDPGLFYPSSDAQIIQFFLNQGGVLVNLAPRGQNNYGEAWHRQGSKFNRIKTFEDVIHVSQYLIDRGWTSGRRITLGGTSAGGLATLSSGLLAPQNFGLLMPISPPIDIIAKVRLDARFGGQKDEYGDPADPAAVNYMKTYSPLELDVDAATMPEIFLLAGLNDSRVNVEHSFKLVHKLRNLEIPDQKFNVLMAKNAGHWLNSMSYQDLIGWRVTSMYWERIFRFYGWQPPTH